MKKYTLKNGLISLFYPIEGAYSVSLSLNIRAGVFTENAENNGITHLLEHLHFRRLGNVTQEKLYYDMDIIGGNLYGETYREMLRFKIKVRPKYLYDALLIFKNILKAYNWTDDDIESEKEIVLREIEEKECCFDFDKLARQTLLKNTRINMPVLGNKKSLLNLRKNDIVAYKKRIFTQNDVALVITGAISDKEQEKINAYFEDIILEKRQTEQTSATNDYKSEITILDYDTDYISCVMSFKVFNNINKYALNLLNAVLGEGQTSLLQRKIREKDLLSYDIYSYIESYNNFSLLNICFSTDIKNFCVCAEKIVEHLNYMKLNISDKEMKSTLTYFTDNMWYLLESPQLLNEELSWEIFSQEEKTVEKRIEAYEKINNYHLSALARKIFHSSNCSVVVMSKAANISETKLTDIINKLS